MRPEALLSRKRCEISGLEILNLRFVTLFPLILRELRCESRRPGNHWLRISGAGLIVLFMMVSMTSLRRFEASMSGRGYFEVMSLLLVASIWIIVPLLTADCVSRERREGTLPLLFLTPLTPMEVATAKSGAQIIRALSVVIAVLPMLMVPILMGGVTWVDGVKTAILALGCVFVALSFGLLASTRSKRAGAAIITALLFSAIAASLFSMAHVW